jgi:hypothetical protein
MFVSDWSVLTSPRKATLDSKRTLSWFVSNWRLSPQFQFSLSASALDMFQPIYVDWRACTATPVLRWAGLADYKICLNLPPPVSRKNTDGCKTISFALVSYIGCLNVRYMYCILFWLLEKARTNGIKILIHSASSKWWKTKVWNDLPHWQIYEMKNLSLLWKLKGTQDWEFFWLRFWNLRYFVDSYVKILRF